MKKLSKEEYMKKIKLLDVFIVSLTILDGILVGVIILIIASVIIL